jgi:hypothetical protein
MQSTRVIVLFLLIGLAFAAVSPSRAQSRKPFMRTDEILATIKPGQWAKLEGVVQKDFTALCKQVEILTGDFLDDEWEITAVVQQIDKEKKEFTLLRLPVKLHKDAEFEMAGKSDGKREFKSFDDLQVGMLVELEGTYLKDGTFLAKEIDDETSKVEREPELKGEVELMGRVDKVDVKQQTITVMGITFMLTEKTKGKSVIK